MRKFFTRSRTVRRLRFFAVVFILLSLLNRLEPRTVWMWQASVLTKEFGFWFALLGLWIAFRFFRWRRRLWASATLVGTLLFAGPLWDALSLEDTWRKELQTGLRTETPVGDLLKIRTLFIGRPEAGVPFRTIDFKTAGDDTLSLDFYPSDRERGPSPLVVVVHGGSWAGGSSKELPELNSILARRGYAVAAVNYRLAPKFKWPAQRDDVTDAVAYLRSHAGELGVDPQNVFLLGRSAGGQLAGVVAYGLRDAGVRGLIAFYTPTDLVFGYETGDEHDLFGSRPLLRDYMGATPYESPAAYAESSMVEMSEKSSVPTLLLHGRQDTPVWYKHSERLAFRLKQRGVPCAFVELWSATHGFDYNINGPSGQVSTSAILYFLNEFSKAK